MSIRGLAGLAVLLLLLVVGWGCSTVPTGTLPLPAELEAGIQSRSTQNNPGSTLPDRVTLQLQRRGEDVVAELSVTEVGYWLAEGRSGIESIDLALESGARQETATARLRQGQAAKFTFSKVSNTPLRFEAIAFNGSDRVAQGFLEITPTNSPNFDPSDPNPPGMDPDPLNPEEIPPEPPADPSASVIGTLSLDPESGIPLLRGLDAANRSGSPLALTGKNLNAVEQLLQVGFTPARPPLAILQKTGTTLQAQSPLPQPGSGWLVAVNAQGLGLGRIPFTSLAQGDPDLGWTLRSVPLQVPQTDPPTRLLEPTALAVGKDGTLWIADPQAHQLFRLALDLTLQRWAGSGIAGGQDGERETCQFQSPVALVVGGDGILWVADRHSIRRTTPTGTVETWAGGEEAGFADGDRQSALFSNPQGLALDQAGNLYVADTGNHRIRRISGDGIVTTVAGSGQPGSQDGPALKATLNQPSGITWADAEHLWIADTGNHRLRVLTPNGQLLTLSGQESGDQDGSLAEARFQDPSDILADDQGRLWVIDSGRIRQIHGQGSGGEASGGEASQTGTETRIPKGGEVVTLTGGSAISPAIPSGDSLPVPSTPSPAPQLIKPTGLAWGSSPGLLWIADPTQPALFQLVPASPAPLASPSPQVSPTPQP